MGNLYELPFETPSGEKTASNEPSELARILTSGTVEDFQKILTAEDRAFLNLSENTVVKLASFQSLNKNDVEAMDDDEVASLTLLGKQAMYKVAAYVDFLAQAEEYEKIGRSLAQHTMMMMKTAEAEKEQMVESLADHPQFIEATKLAAKKELEKRKTAAEKK